MNVVPKAMARRTAENFIVDNYMWKHRKVRFAENFIVDNYMWKHRRVRFRFGEWGRG